MFDLADFDRTIHDASLARSAGDNDAAAEELRRAVQLYTGEVLPEDGPAEWVSATRERYRLRAAEAAASLAGLELHLGNPADAAAAATRSVEIDPWRDESWRTLVETFRRLGDPAAAERAQRRYDLILNSLGVPAASALFEHGSHRRPKNWTSATDTRAPSGPAESRILSFTVEVWSAPT